MVSKIFKKLLKRTKAKLPTFEADLHNPNPVIDHRLTDRQLYEEAEKICKSNRTLASESHGEDLEPIIEVVSLLRLQQQLGEHLDLDNHFIERVSDMESVKRGHIMVTGMDALSPSYIMSELEENTEDFLGLQISIALQNHFAEYENAKKENQANKNGNTGASIVKIDTGNDVKLFISDYLGNQINSKNFEDVYKLGKKLGSGATSVVYECETLSTESGQFSNQTKIVSKQQAQHKKYAVKVIKIGRKMNLARMICFEVEILKTIRQNNLVRAFDCFLAENYENQKTLSMLIVMDLIKGFSISQISSMLVIPEKYIGSLGCQILNGIKYLHMLKISHRDLKGENIFFSTETDHVKIIDFGFCADMSGAKHRKTLVGTYNWMAPEVIRREQYTFKVDIWSFGIVLIEMFQGEPPMASMTPEQIMKTILITDFVSKLKIEANIKLSKDAESLLYSCLNHDPAKRLTAAELLQHKYFVTFPFDMKLNRDLRRNLLTS